MPDLREDIKSALGGFLKVGGTASPSSPTGQGQAGPTTLREAAIAFLGTLGYASDRTLELGGSAPAAFREFLISHPTLRHDLPPTRRSLERPRTKNQEPRAKNLPPKPAAPLPRDESLRIPLPRRS